MIFKFRFIDLTIDKKLTVESGQLTVKVSALPTILNHFAKQNTETINYQLSTINSDDGNAARADRIAAPTISIDRYLDKPEFERVERWIGH